jgi:hypothetical protein
LLDYRRIRSRIQEAQKQTDPADPDPDPQHGCILMLLSLFSKVEPLTSSLSSSSERRRRNPGPSQIWPLGRPEAVADFLFFLQ